MLVIHPQDRFQVGEKVLFFQPFADDRADDRCAAQAAPGKYFKADLTACICNQLYSDIVRVDRCPVLGGATDRDLEFARQECELRV